MSIIYIAVHSIHYFASRISKPLPRIHNTKTKTRVVQSFGKKNKACYGSAREPFDTQIISAKGVGTKLRNKQIAYVQFQ